ncbi:hypothetical protein COO60DRAFT_594519 [Scenedesmus sp. NREL 46B-D3]|nr:hypothetical protein COO60DRAFT_594519 [Scenedesmus sp. NREL 46B-D3]
MCCTCTSPRHPPCCSEVERHTTHVCHAVRRRARNTQAGRADHEGGSAARLAEDPLRLLRCVRLVAGLGLRLAPATAAAVRAHAHLCSTQRGERRAKAARSCRPWCEAAGVAGCRRQGTCVCMSHCCASAAEVHVVTCLHLMVWAERRCCRMLCVLAPCSLDTPAAPLTICRSASGSAAAHHMLLQNNAGGGSHSMHKALSC